MGRGRQRGLPTHYRVDGTTLTQVVEHREGTYAYGITADPSLHWWGVQFTLSHHQTSALVLAMNSGAGTAAVIAAVCGGTIAGAIPCAVGYGVFAGLAVIGTGFLSYCDRDATGIYLKYHWGGWWTCGKR